MILALSLCALAAELRPSWYVAAPPMAPTAPYAVAWSGPATVVVGGSGYVSSWSTAGVQWQVPVTGSFVRGVASATEAPWVAVGGDDGRVRLLNRGDGSAVRELGTFAAGSDRVGAAQRLGWVSGVAVSPDDALVAAVAIDGRSALWRAADGKAIPIKLPLEPSRLEQAVFHPRGDRLYLVGQLAGSQVAVVDPRSGVGVAWPGRAPAGAGHGQSLAVSPDGALVAVGYWGGWVEVRTAAGEPRWSQRVSQRGWAGPLAFTPDGAHLVVAAPEGLTVHLADQGEVVARNDVPVTGIAMHPDGQRLATVHHPESRVRHFSLPSLRALDAPDLPYAAADQLSVSPDGARLAVGSSGGPGVRLLDAPSGRLVRALPAVKCVGWGGIKWDPTGQRVALHDCDYARGVSLLRADSWTPAVPQTFSTNGEAWFSGDGQHLIVMDAFAYAEPRVVRTRDGRPVPPDLVGPNLRPFMAPVDPTQPGHTPPPEVTRAVWGGRSVLRTHWLNQHLPTPNGTGAGASYTAYSRDLQRLAALNGRTLTIYDEGRPVATAETRLDPRAVVLSPDGRSVVVGYGDGALESWRIERY